MISATIQLDLDVLDAVRETAIAAPAQMRREMGVVARGSTAQLIVRELSTEPGKPNYPIHWTGPNNGARQRRFVMAKLRREGNLPYERSHRQAQGWRTVLATLAGDDGGVIVVENSNPASQFIQGEFQQGYLSKWPLARLVIRNHQEEMQDETISAWYRVTGVK
jgi:hypothetical protein